MKENDDQLVEKLIKEYNITKTVIDNISTDFPSLKELADGAPLNAESDVPYVADTTTASLVRSIPRNALQQLPIFASIINGSKNNFKSIVCDYLLRSNIFNEDSFGKGLLSTLVLGGQTALAYGFMPFLVTTRTVFGEFGSHLQPLHYSDVGVEPGVLDNGNASYNFVVAHISESRLNRFIEQAKEKGSSWNLKALKELKEAGPDEVDYSQYTTGPEASSLPKESNSYTLITKYNWGRGGEFITFSPNVTSAPLRIIKNRSKFGYQRVLFIVLDPVLLSPYGMSRVRLASPNQNLNNLYYQNIGAMFLLNSKPALFVRGRYTTPVQLKQGARWVTQDPNAEVQIKEMGNQSLNQFSTFMQQTTAQIQNVLGSPSNINQGGNSYGFGNTAPGVKLQKQFLDSSNNEITNILENFIRQYALVALDTMLSEQTGVEKLIIDDKAKNALNRLAEQQYSPEPDPLTGEVAPFVPPVGDDNTIEINWEEFYFGKQDEIDPSKFNGGIEKMTIEIELGIGKNELEEKKRADMQDTLTVLAQNAQQLGPQAQQQVTQISDMLMEETVPEAKRLEMSQAQPMPDVMPPEQM